MWFHILTTEFPHTCYNKWRMMYGLGICFLFVFERVKMFKGREGGVGEVSEVEFISSCMLWVWGQGEGSGKEEGGVGLYLLVCCVYILGFL